MAAPNQGVNLYDPHNLQEPLLKSLQKYELFGLLDRYNVTNHHGRKYPQSTLHEDLVNALVREGERLRASAASAPRPGPSHTVRTGSEVASNASHRTAPSPVSSEAAEGIRLLSCNVVSSACGGFSERLGGGRDMFKGTLRGAAIGSSLAQIPVAVKRQSGQGLREAMVEINVLAHLRHPNIVPVLTCSLDENFLCIVYPRMQESLSDRLTSNSGRASLAWMARVRILADIASGLAFLHEQTPALIHRAIKPSNILLDGDNRARISDFGTARARRGDGTFTATNIAGTLVYMDPLYRENGRLSSSSDIYSLGLIGMQLLTDRIPTGLAPHVNAAIANSTVGRILSSSCTWPEDVGVTLADILVTCTSGEADERPIASHLAAFLETLLVETPPTPVPPPTLICPICQSAPRAVIFSPCNHFVCCETCSRQLCSRLPARCCLCRQEILSVQPGQGASTFIARR